MRKEKVLFIAYEDFTFSGLLQFLEDYTIYNGTYPDFIDMPSKNIARYQSLLLYPSEINNLTFNGIKVRKK